jgi:hypothetical protein
MSMHNARDARRWFSSGEGGGGKGPSPEPATGSQLASIIDARLDKQKFQDFQHWSGSFMDYLALCEHNPAILRNAYQRLYDAILAHGSEKYKVFKKECVRYHFFS